jgi:hypothetical protein
MFYVEEPLTNNMNMSIQRKSLMIYEVLREMKNVVLNLRKSYAEVMCAKS